MDGDFQGSVLIPMPKKDYRRKLPQDLRVVLAANVCRLMDSAQISAQQLGEESGVGPATVKRVLKKKVSTGVDTVGALAKRLGVAPWRLFLEEDAAAQQPTRHLSERQRDKSVRTPAGEQKRFRG